MPRLSILLTGALALAAAAAQADDAARNLAASCATCHGTNGKSVGAMVVLAGYPQVLMIQAMKDFKSGARPATIMHQFAKGYSEAQVAAIAGYYAAQKK